MSAPTVYRSTDSNAPILTGAVGSLVQLLKSCLVTGYGAVRATATIHSNGTTVSNNDTITIDGTTYTWKTALTPAANEVLIGANAAANLSNLAAAIGGYGVAGTNYGTGTTTQANVQVTAVTSTDITLTAYVGGTAGNSIATSKSAANITLTGFAGGSGSNTGGAGWTAPFSGTQGMVFKQGGGNLFYMLINDNGPGAGLGKEARIFASEACTAYSATAASSTSLFPSAAQQSNGLFIRKSATSDSSNRAWIVVADDRTVYVFVSTGDLAATYLAWGFGDYYSLLSGDNYRTFVTARATENSATSSIDKLDVISMQPGARTASYYARGYTGTGGSVNFSATAASDWCNGSLFLLGQMAYPNPVDGGVYASRITIGDTVTAPAAHKRGWFRGLWHFVHPNASVIDGDTFTATSGDFAGRSFLIIKLSGNGGMYLVETSNTWDTSS